jgi:hypothetical protein
MCRSRAPHLNALVSAPAAFLDDGGLIHPFDAHVRGLAAGGRVQSIDDFPLAGLVGDSVADLELHRPEARRGRRAGVSRTPGSVG